MTLNRAMSIINPDSRGEAIEGGKRNRQTLFLR